MICTWCARDHGRNAPAGPEGCLVGVLLVCGGRNYRDADNVHRVLNAMARRMEILAVRHGGAWGADRLAGMWAERSGIPVQVYPATWKPDGPDGPTDKGAGPKRNQEMIDAGGIVAAVAFPGAAGTADMVRRLKAAGVPVWEVR